MKAQTFHKAFFARALADFVKCLRASGSGETTTKAFVEYCSGPYLTAVKTPPELSFNAQCGRMISILRDECGLVLAGSKRFIDAEGNRTQTAIWILNPI